MGFQTSRHQHAEPDPYEQGSPKQIWHPVPEVDIYGRCPINSTDGGCCEDKSRRAARWECSMSRQGSTSPDAGENGLKM